MNLTDTFAIDGVKRTSDGYIAAFARVARTGIQEYRGSELGRPDLDKVRVYRPAEEVFNADAMRSFAHRPITLKHPPVAVNAANWKKYAGGQTGEDVVRDGEYVRVPMIMMDAAMIKAYEKHGIKELSMGYSTDIKWVTGVTDAGEPYDAIQTEIRGNHLALVPQARGGDKLRVGDNKKTNPVKDGMKTCPECGASVDDSEDTCPECGYDFEDDNINDGENTMTKLVIDGVPVNVADDQSAAIIERHLAKLIKDAGDAAEAVEKAKADAKLAQDAAIEKQKLVEAKDGEIVVLKKQLKDSEITPDKLDVMVKDRLGVIDAAKALLDKSFVFDGKTVGDIRRAAVACAVGDEAVKAMSDDAIGGAFVALTADAKSKGGGVQPLVRALDGHRPSNGRVNAADAAYEERAKLYGNAWQSQSK